MTDRLDSGTVVDGRYRIDHLLGSGGMADVYCAVDEQLGRTVALKLLYRRFAQDQEFVERFRREASAAAGLQHQHIVSVYDRGEWGGTYYIAMEHLTGGSLKALVTERAPLLAAEATDLTIQILRAARFAHRRGIIHRDFKPHNVLVDEEGRATVTDFGIARAGASEMTQTGSIMGTAQYLSPEQAQGHTVSAQSDLYSIGVVLYELLTGRVPFDGESAVTIALKQVTEAPVPPRQINPAVPPALEAVVLRALEKDPAARFASADDFIDALEASRQGVAPAPAVATQLAPGPITASHAAVPVAASYARPIEPYDDGPGRRWWIFAVLALLVVGGVIAALLLTRDKQVVVPRVVGLTQSAASAELTAAGFSVDTKIQVTTSGTKGQVLGQSPSGGRKAVKGSVVTLTVADVAAKVSIPTVEGETSADARRRLTDLGLKVKTVTEASDTVATGIAVRTEPGAATKVNKGASVRLIVSSGSAQVAVPSVVGQTEAQARAALTALGLTVGAVTNKDDDKADPGTVLSQTPGPATNVDKGTSVALVLARAPREVTVPNVLGQDGDAAQATIQDAGFRSSASTQDTTDQTQDGVVISQNPAGGRAARGSTVSIVVGRFTTTGPTGTGGTVTP